MQTEVCSVVSDSLGTSWTVTHRASLSMEFSRQEYWIGLLFPDPGDLPDPGIEPGFLASSDWQAESLPLSHLGSPYRFSARVNKNLKFRCRYLVLFVFVHSLMPELKCSNK